MKIERQVLDALWQSGERFACLGFTLRVCERLSKMALKRSHGHQDRALPRVKSFEGDIGPFDVKFGNMIQYAASGVWELSGVDFRVKVHLNLRTSEGFGASVPAVE